MGSEASTALISIAGALLVAVAGYVFTKRAEREAAWRTEKLEHYKALLASLNGLFADWASDEGQMAYARACNSILLLAPQPVLDALFKFQDEIRESNPNRSQQGHDDRLRDLVFAIREDLNIPSTPVQSELRVRLWVPGRLTSSTASGDEGDGSSQ